MNKSTFFSLLLACLSLITLQTSFGQGNYQLVVEGFDWGPGVSKVILHSDEQVENIDTDDFQVFVTRNSEIGAIPPQQSHGKLEVLQAYISDSDANKVDSGNFVTLTIAVAPFKPLTSPIQYFPRKGGNKWVNYKLTILRTSTQTVWNTEKGRVIPLIDDFDLSGRFMKGDMTMSYASFAPEEKKVKAPLLIWLHGGGEGGTDPSIPLIGNRAANYASDEIQSIFEGAYVLVPQAPTFWMNSVEGGYTRGDKNDIYNEALMELIKEYVDKNPSIDKDRIYIGGCSNGGYMSLKLILNHPDYFAAGFISALAYQSQYISDSKIQDIKNVPIWFVQSKDDKVTDPKETAVPLYQRLKKAGASNVHFSYYDHVVDITGVFGGEDYHYNGHWSWIYVHANKSSLDFDGSPVKVDEMPVSIMQWIASQRK